MKPEKLCPSPTGSISVNRNRPAGRLVSNRIITICIATNRIGAPRAIRFDEQRRMLRKGEQRR